MCAGLSGCEGKRTQEPNHGRKTLCAGFTRLGRPCLLLGCNPLAVTADGKQTIEHGAIGPGDIIVDVPGRHAQRLPLIEVMPRIRRPKAGQPQKTVVDDRHCISHRPPGSLTHAERGGFIGREHLRQIENRCDMGSWVRHLDRNDPIHADRQIVQRLQMRLQEGHVDVDIGRHFLRGGERVACNFPHALDPVGANHLRPRLDAHQRTTGRCGGNRYGDLLSGNVGLLVRLQRQDCRTPGSILARPPRPAGPVDVDGLAGAVTTCGIPRQDQIPPPRRVVDLEFPGGMSVHEFNEVTRDGGRAGCVRVAGEVVLSTGPPPPPVDFVQRHANRAAVDGIAAGIHEHDVDLVLLISEEHAAGRIPLRRADADIARQRRHRHTEAVNTESPSRLEDPHAEVGGEHAGRRPIQGEGMLEGCLAVLIQGAAKDLLLILVTLPRGIIEGVLGEFRKAGASRLERHLNVGSQVPGNRAMEPGCREGSIDR